jgi:hypothetical protein
MNIFVLDRDIQLCAQYHNDKHCTKMILEHVQLLSTACRLNGIDAGYKPCHINHPCSVWVRESKANWLWLFSLTVALHREYQYRWQKTTNHKSFDVLLTLPVPKLPELKLTRFARAMPNEVKIPGRNGVIKSYRNYYRQSKQHLATWTRRDVPPWFLGE